MRAWCAFARHGGHPVPRGSWLAAVWLAGGLTAAPALALAAADYGPVHAGESLWQIAGRVYPGEGLAREQIMLALLQANPDAFTPSCNVNGALRVGARLRLPPPARVAALDAEAARRAVEQQARDWTAHRQQRRPLECPAVAPELAPDFAGEPPAAELGAEAGGVGAQGPDSRPVPDIGPERPAAPCPAPSVCPDIACPETICPTCPDIVCPPAPPPSPSADRVPTTAARLAPGPRAPAWLLVPLLLGLIAFAMLQGERRRAILAAWRAPAAALAAAQLPQRARLLLSPARRESRLLLLLAALAGVLGALATVLFHEGMQALQWLISGHSGSLVEISLSLPPWQRLLLPTLGGLLAGLILQELGQRLGGRRTTDYMEAIAHGDGWISVRHSLVKGISSLVTVASGGSIGREGAMVQLAAMTGSALGRIGGLSSDARRLLVAAGAAAGLAAAYHAPLAATLFVAEIVLGSIAIEHIGPLVIAAVIASVTVHDLFGYAPVYRIPDFALVSDWELGLYLVLGWIAGHAAPVFLRLLERAHQWFGRLPWPLAGRMTLGGLIVGAISLYEPQVWGNGYSVVNAVLLAPWVWQALLTVLVLKMFATAATHGSGAVGGAFTPTLFVGALLGALFGTLVQTVLPSGTAPPNAYAVVGMGAMLAGTTHAPLMSILMVFEMTLDDQILLPLMLAVVTAHFTARRYTGVKPLYAESLLPRETVA